ncbi:MAG: hypothetical protein JO353_06500 [Phycisphaerae bacterium]|nr:hypothetical protein [Phycisphaerae bacterium]
MTHSAETANSRTLRYPQVAILRCMVKASAAVMALIGIGFFILGQLATISVIHGKLQHAGIIPPIFMLAGIVIIVASAAMVFFREAILIDTRLRTVERRRSWGPLFSRQAFPGLVSSIVLRHDTLNSGGRSMGTVCVFGLMGEKGPFWKLAQCPTLQEALDTGRSVSRRPTADYDNLVRAQATELAKLTGWRIEDRLDPAPAAVLPADIAPVVPSAAEIDPLTQLAASLPPAKPAPGTFVPAASEPVAWRVEDMMPSLEVPAWLQRPAPRQIRQRGRTLALSILALVLIIVLPIVLLSWVGWHYWAGEPLDKLTADNHLGRTLWLLPYAVVGGAFALAREKRIARAKHLAQRGAMVNGLLLRRTRQTPAARSDWQFTINGIIVSSAMLRMLDGSQYDPDKVRYEFLVGDMKYIDYINADLLGVFRRDGLVAVVYDPLRPDIHLPLPVVKRYIHV